MIAAPSTNILSKSWQNLTPNARRLCVLPHDWATVNPTANDSCGRWRLLSRDSIALLLFDAFYRHPQLRRILPRSGDFTDTDSPHRREARIVQSYSPGGDTVGPIRRRVSPGPNSILIGSAVFAWLTVVTNKQPRYVRICVAIPASLLLCIHRLLLNHAKNMAQSCK